MEMAFDTCEGGEDLTRTIREIDKDDHETILWSFSRVLDLHRDTKKPLPTLATVEVYRQPERTTWLVDDVGLIIAVRDKPHRAQVHIVFWDRRLRGREVLCRGVADYAIHRWHLAYICTTIPETSRATLEFAKRVGFEEVLRENGEVHLVYTTEVVSP